jgi:hypothetical protein
MLQSVPEMAAAAAVAAVTKSTTRVVLCALEAGNFGSVTVPIGDVKTAEQFVSNARSAFGAAASCVADCERITTKHYKLFVDGVLVMGGDDDGHKADLAQLRLETAKEIKLRCYWDFSKISPWTSAPQGSLDPECDQMILAALKADGSLTRIALTERFKASRAPSEVETSLNWLEENGLVNLYVSLK